MRSVREIDTPADGVTVWAETTRFWPRRVLAVDAVSDPPSEAKDRIALFDQAVCAIGDRIRAVAADGMHLRAQGRRWSFGGVAACDDVILETHGTLAQLLDVAGPFPSAGAGPLASALAPSAEVDDGRAYVFVEAGAEIDELMKALDARGLSVITAGSSSGQSLAGVIATGTHGADFDLPPIADAVRALVLIGTDGHARWVEPAGDPLSRPDADLTSLLPSLRAEDVVRDDDAFDAALVSVGVLGVVAGVVLQVRRQYGLREVVERTTDAQTVTWEGVRGAVRDGSIFDPPAGDWMNGQPMGPGERYRSLELLINPYAQNGAHLAHLARRVEAAELDAGTFARTTPPILDIVTTLTGANVRVYRDTTEKLLRAGRDDTKVWYPAHSVLNYGDDRFEKTWTAELCVRTDAGRHVDAIDDVLRAFDRLIDRGKLVAGFLAIRFTKASRASIAMQTGPTGLDGRYCHIEMHVLQRIHLGDIFDHDGWLDLFDEDDPARDGELFFQRFLEIGQSLRAKGRARFHWGQLFGSSDDLTVSATTHPELPRWRRGAARLLGDQPYVFANPITARAGLIEWPRGFTLDAATTSGRGVTLPDEQQRALASTPPVVATGAGGAARLFACTAHAEIATRPVAGGEWTSLRRGDEALSTDSAPAGPIAAGIRLDGRGVVAARDGAGRLRVRHQRADGRWDGWSVVASGVRSDPAMVAGPGGALRIFAVVSSGAIHRWREDGDGWARDAEGDRFARPVVNDDALDAVGAPAVAPIAGAVHVVARFEDGRVLRARDDAPLAWHEVPASGGVLVASGPPAVATDGAELLVAAPLADGRLWARRFDDVWNPENAPSITSDAPGLLPRTRLCAWHRPSGFAITFTDAARRARLFPILDGGWPSFGSAFEVSAVSAPALVGGDLVVKVAHDLLVKRPV